MTRLHLPPAVGLLAAAALVVGLVLLMRGPKPPPAAGPAPAVQTLPNEADVEAANRALRRMIEAEAGVRVGQ